MKRFPLAPMSPLFKWLTIFCLLLPVFFLASLLHRETRPLVLVGMFLAFIYSTVWFWWRPGSFSVGESELKLHFPLRTLTTPRDQILSCQLWNQADLKARYGYTYRVGAGGLWGGFGWLRSSSKEWIEFYISRQDNFLYIERKDHNPLLITPDDPEAMLLALS